MNSGLAKVLILIFGLGACVGGTTAAAPESLLIYAGAASKPPTEEAARQYEKKTGVKIDLVIGGSGYMLSQMKLAKQGDICFPGSSDYMEKAKRDGIVYSNSKKVIVYLVPSINVAKGNPHGIRTLKDLTKSGIRVVVANPEGVCAGAYAVEIVENALSPAEEYQPLLDKQVEATGIGELLSRFPDTLSGGERQRVALVRALASQPRLVLLDEPFTSLNESLRRELWWLMRDLQSQHGLTVLLVTHNLTEDYFLADNISILIDGEIKQAGRKTEVYCHPVTSSVARFLGINNLWNGTVIGQVDGVLTVECPTIGITAHFQEVMKPPATSTSVTVGILAEHVSLHDAVHPSRPGEHLLTGQIRLLDFSGRWLIQFHHESSPLVLDLHASQRTVDAFGLIDGQSGVTVGLPPSALFWMPREK